MLKCDAEICWNVEYRGIVTFCDMPGQVQEAQEQARGFRIPEDVHAGPIWK